MKEVVLTAPLAEALADTGSLQQHTSALLLE